MKIFSETKDCFYRAIDMAVCVRYTGIPQENIKIQENLKKSIENFFIDSEEKSNLYILPTYTALIQLTKISHYTRPR